VHERGIEESELVLTALLLAIGEMLSAVLSALSSAIACCSCFCFEGCADFGTTDCCCSGGSGPKCFSNARSSISSMSLVRALTCSAEKPGIEI